MILEKWVKTYNAKKNKEEKNQTKQTKEEWSSLKSPTKSKIHS